MKDLLLRYVLANRWANERLLDVVLPLTEEQHNQELTSSFSTLRKTLLHIWGAESAWLLRLHDVSPTIWKWMDYTGTMKELKRDMLDIDDKWIEYVGILDEDLLEASFSYNSLDGKPFSNLRAEVIQHCMNHSTFHRGQLVTMLRQLGVTKIPATDFIAFCRAH